INSTFVLNHAAHAGGTAHVRNADDPSYVEFHDCVIVNSTAGEINVKDDQGEGGAFSVGEGSTLVLMNTTVRGCSAAKQGGAIRLASGDDWEEPGGAVVLRSSTFESNQ
ncbi:unnamed protein product, partial [Sphacelaria rigidula]